MGRLPGVSVWPKGKGLPFSSSRVGRRPVGRGGREASYLAPPARICSFPAYGSYLGCVTAKRRRIGRCEGRRAERSFGASGKPGADVTPQPLCVTGLRKKVGAST